MGAEISSTEDFHSFEKNFVFIKQFQCPNYGEIKLMKHPTLEQYVAIKIMLQQGLLDPKKREERALEQKNMKHESLAQCINVFFNDHEELCGKFIKIHLAYEYIQRTLQQEMEFRANNHEFFSENEVLSLIFSVISALVFLKSHKKTHGDINPSHILLTKEGKYKITDIQYLTEFDEYKRFFAGLGSKCYLSPLLFKSLGHRSLTPIHNEEKSCVFSLGMTIVQLGLLEYPIDLYNFDTFEINEKSLKGFQNKKALGLYSERFQKLLWQMIAFNENERIGYDGILQELDIIKNSNSFIYNSNNNNLVNEYVEKPKKAHFENMMTTNKLTSSAAKTLEKENLFDDEEEIMISIPTNIEQVYEKIFHK